MTLSQWPDTLFDRPEPGPVLRLVDGDGWDDIVTLPVRRWHDDPSPEELQVLARAEEPVIDIGCGPGRHVAALLVSGRVALGIDISAAAVRAARRRGAPAVRASVFADVPGEGSWMTALLLDGNIGIGGDPTTLLRRVGALLAGGGTVLVELDGPGVTSGQFAARVEDSGSAGPHFEWARIGTDEIAAIAGAAGFAVREVWCGADRWFAHLGWLGPR